jgi:hypothetical protein
MGVKAVVNSFLAPLTTAHTDYANHFFNIQTNLRLKKVRHSRNPLIRGQRAAEQEDSWHPQGIHLRAADPPHSWHPQGIHLRAADPLIRGQRAADALDSWSKSSSSLDSWSKIRVIKKIRGQRFA